jgi:hypothetical protein
MEDTKYFSRSWAMLTRDRGWFKPLLVMAAAHLVPVAGYLGNKGYGLEWARLTAWGVDAAPKQKGVKVGKCIGSGWRGFVVDLGLALLFGLAMAMIGTFVGIIPGAFGNLLEALVSLASVILSVVVAVALMVAEVRAAIYERISAGYSFKNIYAMIKRDTRGFFKLVLIGFVASLVTFLLLGIVALLVGIMFAPAIMATAMGSSSTYSTMMALGTSLALVIPVGVFLGYALSIFYSGYELVMINAVGLWMRQFNVAEWGRSEDPLPSQSYVEQQESASPRPFGDVSNYEQSVHESYNSYDQSDVLGSQEYQREPEVQVTPLVVHPAAMDDQIDFDQADSQETLVLPSYGDQSEFEQPGLEDVDPTVILGSATQSESVLESAAMVVEESNESEIDELYEDFLTVVKESDRTDDE